MTFNEFRQTVASTLATGDPVRSLIVEALLAKDAGEHRLHALREWMSQASVDEIADDIQTLFQQLASDSRQQKTDDQD